jgi:class 3 adenylate cyclase/tetratricopeptide (TPR) repeat protein
MGPAGLRFCGQCGAALDGPAPGPAPVPTPAHLARKILTSRAALEGERKQVSILFADLRGSLELLDDRDPEEARGALDPALERMTEAVHHYEGTVNQVLGDGIMALFGAPLAHEDHAVRACYAALRMQDAVRRLAEETRRAGGAPVAIRVGIDSGEVVVRAIGTDLRMDYTAVGHTTHLAARMAQAALPGSILIAGDTLRLVDGYVRTRSLGPIQVKGLTAPVEAHEVTGLGPVRTRLEAAAARGLTRFVARGSELGELRRAMDKAGQGHGQVVAVIGEPGVGKSRLLYEFVRSEPAHAWLVLDAGAVPYGRATPYLPLVELLRGYFGIREGDDHRGIRDAVAAKLAALDPALEPAAPALLGLFGAASDDAGWLLLDPRERRRRTLEAARALLLRESRAHPLCVVLEDLQWIDSETRAFLDGLVESLPPARILLLVSYRPEYQHGWGARSGYTHIRLGPLPPGGSEELLDGLVGRDSSLDPLKRALVDATDGNPFFLEECVRSLVETGVLAGARGACRLAGPLPAAHLPPTVHAVLAARIDRLPEEDKRLLEIAAVIGKDVPRVLLEAVADRPLEAVQEALAHLQAAELLHERGFAPDLTLTFTHTLTHEVAYQSLLAPRRRELHGRIADAMERLHAEQLAEHAERLADHALRAELWPRALGHLHVAAERALLRSANRAAVALLTDALVLLPEEGDRAHVEQLVDLSLMLRNALYILGDSAQGLVVVRRAERLAARLGDRRRLAQIWAYMAQHLRHRGEHAEAIRSGERALAAAEAPADDTVRLTAGLALSQAYHTVGDFRRAIEVLVMTVPGSLEGNLRRIVWIDSRVWLAWSLVETGAFEEARSVIEEAAFAAEALEYGYAEAITRLGRGGLWLWSGRPDRALEPLEQSVRIARRGEIVHPFLWAAPLLGSAYLLAGQPAAALPLFEEAVAAAERRNILAHQSWRLACLAEGYLGAGHAERALRTAETALGLAQRCRERPSEARTLKLLAEIAAARSGPGDPAAAALYRQALALAEALGMRPLVALCHLGLGLMLERTGASEARRHLDVAAAMLRAMDLAFWLDQAEAARARLAPAAARLAPAEDAEPARRVTQ